MDGPGILFILFIILLVIVGLTMIIKIVNSKTIYSVSWKIFLFALIFSLYVLICFFMYMYVFLPLYDMLPKKEMMIWDNIWYAILLVCIMLFLATLVKSIRDNRAKMGLAYMCIGTFFILILYTVLYYIFMFNESLWLITIILGIIAAGLAIMLIIITRFLGIHSRLLFPFYLIFSVSCLMFIVCLFWLIIRGIEWLYNYINNKK